jgi:hypothetical protein
VIGIETFVSLPEGETIISLPPHTWSGSSIKLFCGRIEQLPSRLLGLSWRVCIREAAMHWKSSSIERGNCRTGFRASKSSLMKTIIHRIHFVHRFLEPAARTAMPSLEHWDPLLLHEQTSAKTLLRNRLKDWKRTSENVSESIDTMLTKVSSFVMAVGRNYARLSSETQSDHRRCTYTRPGIRGVRFSVILVGSSSESRAWCGRIEFARATCGVAWCGYWWIDCERIEIKRAWNCEKWFQQGGYNFILIYSLFRLVSTPVLSCSLSLVVPFGVQ